VSDRYCLRVMRDGTEIRFAGRPDHQGLYRGLRVHDVRVIQLDDGSLIDEIVILTIEDWPPGCISRIISPPAHGCGWKIHDATSDKRTIWRRPHKPQACVSIEQFREMNRVRRSG